MNCRLLGIGISALLLLASSPPALAGIVLKGDKLTVGVNDDGSLITDWWETGVVFDPDGAAGPKAGVEVFANGDHHEIYAFSLDRSGSHFDGVNGAPVYPSEIDVDTVDSSSGG
jgi:hypothetical protein